VSGAWAASRADHLHQQLAVGADAGELQRLQPLELLRAELAGSSGW
jgi:hypothetical protein